MPPPDAKPADPAGHAPSANYRRERDLPRLIPVGPRELILNSVADHARLVAKLRTALRRERQRGAAGHWTYDVARHARLLEVYRHECRLLEETDGSYRPTRHHAVGAAADATCPAGSRGPCAWRDQTWHAHNSGPPSDSRAAGPTSPDTRRATDHNVCEGDASAT